MTLNLTNPSFPARDRLNDRMVVQAKYTGPASYATGGDAYLPASGDLLGMGEVYAVAGAVISDGSAIRIGWWDYTNQKMLWFVPNTGAQVANAVDLSTFSGYLTFFGKG